MKPIGKAQGKGIFLLNKLSQIAQWKTDYRWKPENTAVRLIAMDRLSLSSFTVQLFVVAGGVVRRPTVHRQPVLGWWQEV
jgi:hypothetical protein